MLLTDDPADHELEAAHAHQRLAALHTTPHWHDRPLVWTISRKSLYALHRVPLPQLSQATLQAIRAAGAAPEDESLARKANELYEAETGGSDARFRNACIILYLAIHQPEDWQPHTRSREAFLSAVDRWCDENVGLHEILQLADVTTALIESAEKTRAAVQPRDHDSDAGN